jgi:hypothetical protein
MAKNEELFPVKFLLAIDEAMDASIQEWRRRQPDLPNKTEAIRRLLAAALSADDGKIRKRA